MSTYKIQTDFTEREFGNFHIEKIHTKKNKLFEKKTEKDVGIRCWC